VEPCKRVTVTDHEMSNNYIYNALRTETNQCTNSTFGE